MKRHAVLVVEDDALIRLAGVMLVEEAGFEALEATNADDAIAILEVRQDIRVVFTDVDMPGSMDGIKLAHFIRERWPPVQIIVASGKTIVSESGLPPGTRFFSKPYTDHAITDTLRAMVAG
jgi:two-component system, response regulator PdtaR